MRYFAAAILWCLSAFSQAPVPKPADAPTPSVKPEDKCSVEGTVVSATTGEPLKKSRVLLGPVGQSNGVPFGTTTDAGGHFVIDGIDPGRYNLLAIRNGYLRQAYSANGNARQSTELTLGKGQKLKELVLKLTPQGAISGRILDEDGEPLPNILVSLAKLQYRRGKRSVIGVQGRPTNDLGEYRVYGLSPGKYVISAKPREEPTLGSAQVVQAAEETVVTTSYPSATSLHGASLIYVTAGAQISGINVTLSRERTVWVKGRVIAGAMAISQDTRVLLQPRSFGMHSSESDIDAKGGFVLRGVPPGAYTLLSYSYDSKSCTTPLPLEVGASNIEGIELTLQPPVGIHGRLVIEANGDLKGTVVNLAFQPRMSGSPFAGGNAQVKDDLSFNMPNVCLETYDLNVFPLPENFYLRAIRIGQEDVTDTGIDLTQGVPPGELTVVLNPNGGQIEGSVKNVKDEPAIGTTVTLIPDEKHRSVTWLPNAANTDQNGRFILKGVRPGEYKIYAWEEMEQDAYQDPDFIKPHESMAETVSIKEGVQQTVHLKAITEDTTANQKPER